MFYDIISRFCLLAINVVRKSTAHVAQANEPEQASKLSVIMIKSDHLATSVIGAVFTFFEHVIYLVLII